MKSLEDLKKLRDQSLKNMQMRYQVGGTRIQVGMGTCGIAAGARPVLNKFVEEINEHESEEHRHHAGRLHGRMRVRTDRRNRRTGRHQSSIYCQRRRTDGRTKSSKNTSIDGKRLDRYLFSSREKVGCRPCSRRMQSPHVRRHRLPLLRIPRTFSTEFDKVTDRTGHFATKSSWS
ncbi:MAG: hypothetical protein MZU97_14450 [Bacillus subtilis]|nr:hypothetical protein [Bacillus subtilis]